MKSSLRKNLTLSLLLLQVSSKFLEPKERSLPLTGLASNTHYRICVRGLSSWAGPGSVSDSVELSDSWQSWSGPPGSGPPRENLVDGSYSLAMRDTAQTKCTEVTTLESPSSIISERGNLASILSRRLGLVVGSCIGLLVSVLLVSVLSYLKRKKHRALAKREQALAAAVAGDGQQLQQQPPGAGATGPNQPPEYLTYRHFSLQGGERLDGHCPSFIGGNSLGS